MAERKVYCDFINGSDTTGIGNGSFASPWKTQAKALSVDIFQQKDKICLLADEPISTAMTIPSVTGYLVNQIVGVNELGIEDGTRRRIYGVSGCTYAYNIGASYTWSFRNIDFDTFSEFVFNMTATYSYRASLSNFSISNCKGLTNNTTFGFGHTGIFEDGEVYNCSGGICVFACQSGIIKNVHFKNCSGIFSIISGANSLLELKNVSLSGCEASYAGYALLQRVFGENIIIDRCALTNKSTQLINTMGPYLENVLITHITSVLPMTMITFASAFSMARNIAHYDCDCDYDVGQFGGVSALYSGIEQLLETPYLNDNGSDFTLKPSYAFRRVKREFGKFVADKSAVGL